MPNDHDMDVDDGTDSDFEAGFTAGPLEQRESTTTPTAQEGEATNPASESGAQPAPKYAQITQEEYEQWKRNPTAIDEIKADNKKRFDDVFGKVGGMEQLLKALQSGTQTGQQIEITKEDFEELIEDGYPDLADMSAKGFNRVLAKLKGTGGQAPQAFDPKQIEEIISTKLASAREDNTREHLFDMHSDWEQVRATPEYEAWVKANKIEARKDRTGASYNDSWNANFIGGLITEFKATKKAASTRQNVLEAAITPKGDGGHSSAKTDDDEFEAGFKSKSH